jgi:hypothetical protein
LIISAFKKFQASLSHWGAAEYIVFAAFWLMLTIPLYLMGWGVFSVFSLLLFLLAITVLTRGVNAILKSSDLELNSSLDVNLIFQGIEVEVLDGHYLENGQPTDEAIKYYTSIIENVNQLKSFVAAEMLDGYNENWLDEEIGNIDELKFKELISLKSILIFNELGYALAYFDDGDLFGGHSIEISINNGAPEYAQIVG